MNQKKIIAFVLIGLAVVAGIYYLFLQKQKEVQAALDSAAALESDNYRLGDLVSDMAAKGKPLPTTYRPGASKITAGIGKYF